jgi:exonuclease III
MLENLKMLVWNVRGLNSKARRIAIRALVATTNASIVCFQETKINLFYSGLILETLGAEFDDFVYLPADGTRGGILLAWQSRTVAITDPIFTTNILTAKVHIAATAPWWLSVVYGPQEEADKVEFLREIRELRPNCPGPWMICGDFNLIYRDEDKNNVLSNEEHLQKYSSVDLRTLLVVMCELSQPEFEEWRSPYKNAH